MNQFKVSKSRSSSNSSSNTGLSSNKRRAALAVIGGSSVAVWHKPLINSVILPAHAQTSNMVANSYFGTSLPLATLDSRSTSSPLDWLISSANAQVEVEPISVNISALVSRVGTTGEIFDLSVLVEGVVNESTEQFGSVLYTGQISNGTPGILNATDNPCEVSDITLAANIVSVSETELVINFPGEGTLTIPEGTGTLSSTACSNPPPPPLAQTYFIEGSGERLSDTHLEEQLNKRSLLDFLIPQANAGAAILPTASEYGLKAEKLSETSFQVTLLNPRMTDMRRGTLSTDGTSGSLVFLSSESCEGLRKGDPRPIDASIISITPAQIQVQITTGPNQGNSTINIPANAGDGMLVATNCSPQ